MILFFLFSSFFSLSMLANNEFIPTKNNCGAAIKADKSPGFPDNINAALACMQAGYRDIYITEKKEFNTIDKKYLSDNNINYIITKGFKFPITSGFDDHIIIYKDSAKYKAAIIAKNEEERFACMKNNIPVSCLDTIYDFSCCFCSNFAIGMLTHTIVMKYYYPKIKFLSWALTGLLLGYDKEDIKYFYEKHNQKEFFDGEYDSALNYIETNKDIALEWLENKLKKNN